MYGSTEIVYSSNEEEHANYAKKHNLLIVIMLNLWTNTMVYIDLSCLTIFFMKIER